MIWIYLLLGLFLVWLLVMIILIARMLRSAGMVSAYSTTGPFKPKKRLAVLMRNQAEGVEGLMFRLAMSLNKHPEISLALLDGGSTDQTDLMLERLARKYHAEFYSEVMGLPTGCLDLRDLTVKDLLKRQLF